MTTVSEYFTERAAQWDAENAGHGVPACVPALAGVTEGSLVLDIGCGTGAIDAALLNAGAAHIDALDVSSGMIECARAKFADEPRIGFHCCDVLDFPAASGRYRCAVLYNMYPHIADKPAVARKVASLLAPDGRFAVIHGTGRETINLHHASVPAEVTSDLLPAETEARVWREAGFAIDTIIDRPTLYCISGTLR